MEEYSYCIENLIRRTMYSKVQDEFKRCSVFVFFEKFYWRNFEKKQNDKNVIFLMVYFDKFENQSFDECFIFILYFDVFIWINLEIEIKKIKNSFTK